MLMKILWGLLIVSNICWFIAFRMVDKDRWQQVSQHQAASQQLDTCQSQVQKLTDAMGKLCTCGK